MPLADHIHLSPAADEDLRAIGGATERLLFGELAGLPTLSEEDCPPLTWQPGTEILRRIDIGDYCVTFTIRSESDGSRTTVVERVVLRADLEAWIAAQIEQAEAGQ
jgi:hypothetical protein